MESNMKSLIRIAAVMLALSSIQAQAQVPNDLKAIATLATYDELCKPAKRYLNEPVIKLIAGTIVNKYSASQQDDAIIEAMTQANMIPNFCIRMGPTIERLFIDLKAKLGG
jgi:hypothetical protein